MKAAQSLCDAVLGILVQAPEVPIAPGEVYGHVTAHTHRVGVLGFLEEVRDAILGKNGVCIHANEVVDLFHANVPCQPAGHGVEEVGRKDALWV